MGSRRDCTWILGLSEFRVVTMDEDESGRLVICIERRGEALRFPASSRGFFSGYLKQGISLESSCI